MPVSFEELLAKQGKLHEELAAAHREEILELRAEIQRLQSGPSEYGDGLAKSVDGNRSGSPKSAMIETTSEVASDENDAEDAAGNDSLQLLPKDLLSFGVPPIQENTRAPASSSAESQPREAAVLPSTEAAANRQEGPMLSSSPFSPLQSLDTMDMVNFMESSRMLSKKSSDGKASECQRCRTVFRDDGDVCRNCGLKRTDLPTNCESCGYFFTDDVSFCRGCGIKRGPQSAARRVSLAMAETTVQIPTQTRRQSLMVPERRKSESSRRKKDDVNSVVPVERRDTNLESLMSKGILEDETAGLNSSGIARQSDEPKPLLRRGDSNLSFIEKSELLRRGSKLSRCDSHTSMASRLSRNSRMSAVSERLHPQAGSSVRMTLALTQMSHMPLEAWPLWHDIMELHEEFETDDRNGYATGYANPKPGAQQPSRSSFLDHEDSQALQPCYRGIGLHPTSLPYLAWITFGVVVTVFDVIALPMGCFDIDFLHGDFSLVWSWFVAVYWSIDTAISFFVGFSYKGMLQMKIRSIAWRYLRTWFLPDVSMVAVDWMVVILSCFADSYDRGISLARLSQLLRAMRTMRILRLVRLTKLPRVLKELTLAFGRSDATSLSIGIAKSFFIIILINHLIACAWFAIGKHVRGGWASTYMPNETQWTYSYLTSLHWSLTQFTPASMDVQPQNLEERAFAVAVLLFAMVTFSSFISSITNLMNHLKSLRGAQARQFYKLERFLRDNCISFHLSSKIRRFVDFQVKEKSRGTLLEKDVEMLQQLSDTLKKEVHYEVHSPWLTKHAFFPYYRDRNMPGMHRLCHTAVRTIILSQEDILFNNGEVAKEMYLVQDGKIEYKRQLPKREECIISAIEPEHFFSELVLWSPWEHRGCASSVDKSTLIGLAAETFHEVVTFYKVVQMEISNYALEVVRMMNESLEPLDFTDLTVSSDIYNPESLCGDVFGTALSERSTASSRRFFSIFHRHSDGHQKSGTHATERILDGLIGLVSGGRRMSGKRASVSSSCTAASQGRGQHGRSSITSAKKLVRSATAASDYSVSSVGTNTQSKNIVAATTDELLPAEVPSSTLTTIQ